MLKHRNNRNNTRSKKARDRRRRKAAKKETSRFVEPDIVEVTRRDKKSNFISKSCGKKARFYTEKQAIRIRNQVNYKAKKTGEGDIVRYYLCHICGGFHLTKQVTDEAND